MCVYIYISCYIYIKCFVYIYILKVVCIYIYDDGFSDDFPIKAGAYSSRVMLEWLG
jgi:hypothetical protein